MPGLRWLTSIPARFNRWIAGTAIAAGTETQNTASAATPIGVKSVLGEIEQETLAEEPEEQRTAE